MTNDEDYDLEVLLELREKEKREAEEWYAEAKQRREECEKEVRRRRRKLQNLIEEREGECRKFDARVAEGSPSIAEIRNFDHYLEGLWDREGEAREEVDGAKKKFEKAKKEVERAHGEMLEAIRQLKAVEKHYEKWKEKQALEKKRRQAAKMDDVAARIWRKQH